MKNLVVLIVVWSVCALLFPVLMLWWLVLILSGSRRAWRLAVAHDQLWNVPWGGSEDETISSRAAKAMRRGDRWGCVLCKLLDRIDPDHCLKNIENDEGRPVA